jgi:hypothetical protein
VGLQFGLGVTRGEGPFLLPRQGFDGSFAAHGGRAIWLRLQIRQAEWPVSSSVARTVSGSVLLEASRGVGRPAGVECAVGTFDHITEILGHARIIAQAAGQANRLAAPCVEPCEDERRQALVVTQALCASVFLLSGLAMLAYGVRALTGELPPWLSPWNRRKGPWSVEDGERQGVVVGIVVVMGGTILFIGGVGLLIVSLL